MPDKRFLLEDRDFESMLVDTGKDKSIEIRKLDNGFYGIFQHFGDSVFESGVFNKKELFLIWKMLTR
jgi:hypothetical protein